jgi:hypothetical protein
MNIKFAYVKDPENTNRVVTIGYLIKGDVVVFNAVVNKVVDPNSLKLDQRLIQVVGRKEFSSIQKRFFKKFKGDTHSKTKARTILTGKISSKHSDNYVLQLNGSKPYKREYILAQIVEFFNYSSLINRRLNVAVDVLERFLEEKLKFPTAS